jgi:hypothetical protein
MRNTTATFIQEVTVTDPDTNAPVTVSIYKHDTTGGMFGIDSSFIEQNFEDDETPTVADPFVNNAIVELIEYEISPTLFQDRQDAMNKAMEEDEEEDMKTYG